MAVLRKERRESYTVIDNAIFKDYEVSFKAKGLLCQMLSLPDGWEYSIEGLAKLSSDGVSAVRSALDELKEAGYFRREQVRENGKIAKIEYVISEYKKCENLVAENLKQENLKQENRTQLNTNTSITYSSTTDSIHIEPTSEKRRFKKPSVDELKEYIEEKGYSVNAEYFYDYYESNGWKVGKTAMKDWKATVRNWDRRKEQDNGKRNNFGAGSKGKGKTDRGIGDNEGEVFRFPDA